MSDSTSAAGASTVVASGELPAVAAAEAKAQDAAVMAVDHLITHPFGLRKETAIQGLSETDFDQRSLALRRAALSVGRTIQPPTPQQRQRGNLRAYAENAGLIVRDCVLPADWWKRDFGPLVGSTSSGETVALIPRRGKYYLTVADGTETKVGSKVAATLATDAMTVIPQLPEPVTNPWQVGRYGLTGNLHWLLLGTAVSLVAGIVTLSAPLATRAIWDTAVPQLDYPLVWGLLFFLAAASFAGMSMKIVEKFASLRVSSRYRAFVSPALWFRLQNVKASYYRENSIGVVSQQAGLVPGLFQLTIDPMFAAIGFFGFGLPSLVLMFVLAPQLAWIALGATAIQMLVSFYVSWRSAKLVQQQFPIGSQETTILHGLLAGLTSLRAAGAEAYGLQQWGEVYHRRQRVTVRMRYLALAVSVFTLVWPIIVATVIYWVTGTQLLGAISVGTFLAFMTTYGFFKHSARELPKTVATFFTLSKVWPRCKPVFEAPLERPLDALDPGVLTGDIGFRGVSFGYQPGRNVLTDVNIQIPAGQFAAFVGPSGAGKSTLVRLIVGLEDPTEGTITYNGVDFARLDVDVVRLQMGVVMQGMRPYGATVREVVDGDRGLGDDQIWRALQAADLADSVHAMDMGLDTFIGSGGQAFSGGEVQRLLFARAVAGDPRVLVLDEATSAFDDITQAAVMGSVKQMEITRVVIAQRLSTIAEADVIYVIDGGAVAESGSYDELVASGGIFASMVAAQGLPSAGGAAAGGGGVADGS